MRAVVVRLVEHRQVRQIALDARLKVVLPAGFAFDHGQRLLAPGAPSTGTRVTPDLGRDPWPFHPRDENEGASEKHEGNHAHRPIVVRG